ncbi:MAG: beta-galactosidase [Mucilaginibacter sp.]|uniref:glycoside hydrolase family 2 protein n=1 Tax=Mucilaginibacter sp. TaxID=1882438 RepID=UPI0026054C56|nr:glycoside hydrolase family 2 TIM barrel-domain containing protein [Mucilaginibacter sp.]MDB5004256.1 beta-galactosidase [Mucilaginibacter sp.]
MANNLKNTKAGNGLSRKNFIQNCAIGTIALSSGSLLGCLVTHKALGQSGAAAVKVSLDQDWLFGGKFITGSGLPGFDDNAFKQITLPHAVNTLSWQDWDVKNWQDVWIYRRHFTIPEKLKGMRIFLKFDGVMTNASPYINGHELPQHLGGYLPFQYEITDFIKDGDNVLALSVDSRWSNVPPDGSPKGAPSVDYLEVGGIHRSVSLQAVPKIFINDVFAKPVDVLTINRRIEVSYTVDAALLPNKSVRIRVEMKDGNHTIAKAEKAITINKIGESTTSVTLSALNNITLWDIDNPKLYDIVTTILVDGQPLHNYTKRIGVRDAKFKLEGFFLNGRRLQLFGLNRHEVYPYVGFAMPARVMRKDAEILKNDFHCNIVRCSHYPQNDAFLDACDELGLMVWEEVPGWQYIGNDAWKEVLLQNVKDMVIRDRNRPSIIIWGTRVNESASNEALYHKTREIAKSLDDSRPTSGSLTPDTRKNWEKDWHEEVFAYDDYHADSDASVGILDPIEDYPYMLAEAVGQFNYPNRKYFNSFYRRTAEVNIQANQALAHAQAHSKSGSNPRNSGVIAWCAFEYSSLLNQYRNVKYPGVSDVFRIPKLGASFYLSQGDPKSGAVIHPNFYWDFGPKSPNGPGKHVAIFSNCERLELFIDNQSHTSIKPDVKNYPNLKHAPFFTDLEFTTKPIELRIHGYVGDVKVCSRSYSANTSQDQFSLLADDKEILGDGTDATRVVFRVLDKFGAPRPFAGGNVTFNIDGPGIIVGDNPFDLNDSGGAAAIWVKARPKSSGIISLHANHATLGASIVSIKVV